MIFDVYQIFFIFKVVIILVRLSKLLTKGLLSDGRGRRSFNKIILTLNYLMKSVKNVKVTKNKFDIGRMLKKDATSMSAVLPKLFMRHVVQHYRI